MMDAQVKQKILEKLKSQCLDATLNEQTLLVRGVIDGTDFSLYHHFSYEFPYEIPELKLSEECLPYFSGLPHVSSDGRVCAFDQQLAVPNIHNPSELVVEVVKETIRILTEGFEGNLGDDYRDEFLAYWNLEAETKIAYTFVEFGAKPKTLFACALRNHSIAELCIASSEESVKQLVTKIEPDNTGDEAIECCYIPLLKPLDYPLPVTHADWMRAIQSNSNRFDYYQNYLQKNENAACLVIVSQPYGTNHVAALFLHNALRKANGFRAKKTPLRVALSNKDGDIAVKRYQINDASQQRLFFRAGTGSTISSRNAIIGCGSLGSYLSDSLASYGCQNYILIDNDLLGVENIARHLCGFSYLMSNKAVALKHYLESHNPNISCNAIEDNGHLILSGAPDLFDNSDALFITAANTPLELHAIKQTVAGLLKTTLVVLWLEPYALAAHALVLNQPQDISELCYNEKLEFRNSIVSNGKDLFKREAGCQSSFVQYSGIDSRAFILDFLRDYYQQLSKNRNKNYHYIWIGNIKEADSYGAFIRSDWKNASSYSKRLERIG